LKVITAKTLKKEYNFRTQRKRPRFGSGESKILGQRFASRGLFGCVRPLLSDVFFITTYSTFITVYEDLMKISDVKLEMELGGVDEADIAEIVKLCESKGFANELLDEELQKRGYEKLFTVDYDDFDEYGDWEDDEYASVEKFPHKQHYRD
jgi:hypothetical protein